jgi:hypothetical protein
MPDVLHLEIQLPPVLQLRLLRPPAELPADMANVIVGPPGDAGGALLVANQLNEFDDEAKKAAARTNLGLQVIDGGTFF